MLPDHFKCPVEKTIDERRFARQLHLKELVLSAASASSINVRNTEDEGTRGVMRPGETLNCPIIFQ